MEHIAQAPRQPGFPGWTQTPIPGVSLSAGGLLALADLTTVAQRTAIKGGSSWLDSLLLVPGLHYQQAADEVARSGGGGWSWGWDYGGGGGGGGVAPSAADGFVGIVNNSALMMYLNRVAHQARERRGGDEVVFLDVGALSKRKGRKGKEGGVDEDDGDDGHGLDLGWLSHWLYLMSPVLTIAALVMLILVEDWWALGCILTLMISRILNIWVIKQRSRKKVHFSPPETEARRPSTTTAESSMSDTSRVRRHRRRHERQQRVTATTKPPQPTPSPQPALTSAAPPTSNSTQITITLPGSAGRVRLRGRPADLHAVTTETWMRAKTRREGYLEAAAKLLVYLVAAVSGNWTQAGAIVVMVLLLASAGLLALSNGCARGVEVNGRIVAAGPGGAKEKGVADAEKDAVRRSRDGDGGTGGGGFYNNGGGSWGVGSGRERRGDNGEMDDWAERGMAAGIRKTEDGGGYPYLYSPTSD
ncbi:uncharacterized protein PpBr36_09455 [Pyricularia pennisetigena]|uniref:uncharacterized protein n=1 Tax=Pyricularia pennisetigena TaxID=1578925 RepID=UPI00114DEF58|nr:uncharacterized protein PpBr36_09455 [Pyricularia pennisetigena]TLS21893.1 hypothetical protein PpBr36_09455 [Pyricularia pennisetigena]